MTNTPCFEVPSPDGIHDILFSNPGPPPTLPPNWTATALLTPFGGIAASPPLSSSDELVAARISYTTAPDSLLLRLRLYLLESLLYYDFAFVTTTTGETSWYWLVSDPADPSPYPAPSNNYGPFTTSSQVPAATILGDAGFAYIGTWNVVNQPCNGFSAVAASPPAATWFSFLSNSPGTPSRIMNVDDTNDFKIPVLGAYYLANFTSFEAVSAPALDMDFIGATAGDVSAGNSMLTLQDIQATMVNPPSGAAQIPCTAADIAAVIPGLSFPQSQPPPPAWTNQVQSDCYMIGQDNYPYYCMVFYDYTVNQSQTSVFVTQDGNGAYTERDDEVLPLGKVGPSIGYAWNGNQWQAGCSTAGGGDVPMSVPNFVQAGGGLCRGIVVDNPYFGPGAITIWSVELGSQQNPWASDFWYWFNSQEEGVVFALAPAGSLTMIDYQTFVQNPPFLPCIFDEPTTGLSPCPNSVTERRQKLMLMPKGGFGSAS